MMAEPRRHPGYGGHYEATQLSRKVRTERRMERVEGGRNVRARDLCDA
jgi:hypothetical protein